VPAPGSARRIPRSSAGAAPCQMFAIRKRADMEGLWLVLEAPRKTRRHPRRGIIDSGIPDLASNPEHLKGFGARHR
jgi:hypothetical protein